MLATACSGGGGGGEPAAAPEQSPLVPTFEPATTSSTAAPAGSAPDSTAPPASPPLPGPGDDPPTTTTVTGVEGAGPGGSATVTDAEADVTLSVERPPAWADLVAATLTLGEGGFELRVRLAGDDAPEASDGDHTFNVASFYDTDGDGRVDHEIWLNLGPDGWGAGWFSPAGARYAEDSGVVVTPEGGEVVARFPWSHLAEAPRFRWSLASEWGRYEAMGTTLAARDDMPDDDRPAHFPA